MKEVLLSALERVGMAWWVEIKTDTPNCIYYFGPFLNRQEAIEHQPGYVEDLQTEGAQNIQVQALRCNPDQLTIGGLEPVFFQPSINAA